MAQVVSAEEAAGLIGDGMTVSVSSSSGLGCPDAVLAAIGARFAATGHPRDITTLHPIAAGDMYGIKGIDHIAQKGLLKRTLCGSYPSGPSSAEPPKIWQMIGANQVAAYNVPSGILFDMHREAAAKRPGVLTKVGLDTFVDPRQQGCAMNAAASDPIVRVWFTRERVVLGREWKQATAGTSRAWLLERPPSRDGASGETASPGEGGAEKPTVLAILPGSYALFFELPDGSPRSRDFAPAFLRRFAVFFENARSDAELSMPAFVDLAD